MSFWLSIGWGLEFLMVSFGAILLLALIVTVMDAIGDWIDG